MTDVTALSSLDLNRYLGRWYEIVRLPLKYEDDAATDITARYPSKRTALFALTTDVSTKISSQLRLSARQSRLTRHMQS